MPYIYALVCPESLAIRYVGKANDVRVRLLAHISDARANRHRHHCSRWIRKLLRAGLKPTASVILRIPDGLSWETAERFFIASARELGFPITNGSAGGEGAVLVSEEAKARWKAAMDEVNSRPEVKAKLSARMKQLWEDPEYRAKIHNERTRAKMSDRSKQNWSSNRPAMLETMNAPSRTARISAAISARNARDAEKIRATQKKYWSDTEHRERRLAAMANTKASPEWRASFAESVTRSWSTDPEARERRAARQRDPEVNAKRSASLRAYYEQKRKAA